MLKIIDPTDYIDTLTLWLGEQEGCLPILMTGFGTLFIYRKLSDTADDMCLLDIHNRRSGSFSTSFSDFFERIIPAENFAAQFLRVGLFQTTSADEQRHFPFRHIEWTQFPQKPKPEQRRKSRFLKGRHV